MKKPLVVILMGSASDLPHVEKITGALDGFGIRWVQHIASAHKTPRRLLDLLEGYEAEPGPKVYVTVAGRSNALSGMVDASVTAPVIACPPPSTAFGGVDIYSSLRMPSGVAPMVVLDPANAALAAAKVFGLADSEISATLRKFHADHRQRLSKAEAELNG